MSELKSKAHVNPVLKIDANFQWQCIRNEEFIMRKLIAINYFKILYLINIPWSWNIFLSNLKLNSIQSYF